MLPSASSHQHQLAEPQSGQPSARWEAPRLRHRVSPGIPASILSPTSRVQSVTLLPGNNNVDTDTYVCSCVILLKSQPDISEQSWSTSWWVLLRLLLLLLSEGAREQMERDSREVTFFSAMNRFKRRVPGRERKQILEDALCFVFARRYDCLRRSREIYDCKYFRLCRNQFCRKLHSSPGYLQNSAPFFSERFLLKMHTQRMWIRAIFRFQMFDRKCVDLWWTGVLLFQSNFVLAGNGTEPCVTGGNLASCVKFIDGRRDCLVGHVDNDNDGFGKRFIYACCETGNWVWNIDEEGA